MSEGPPPRIKTAYAGKHRDKAHASAHADESKPDEPVPVHPLIPRTPAALITRTSELLALIERLRAVGSFAYDSEFIGELTYIPKLCLVQVASTREVALIDPLAEVDLTPFWELLCDASVEKIVHAGEQDIEPVIRILNKAPKNVFDTQIAAGFIALTYPVSLSKLVMELIGARLGKGLTFSHWDQRPLSAQQLRYAADDVRYLPAIHQIITQRLNEYGHAEWARRECEDLCEPAQYQFDPNEQYQRIRGASSLPPRGLAILRELSVWRDKTAQAHNVPPRALAKDEVLVDMSRNPVKLVEKLGSVRGLPRPVETAHGAEIVSAIARGQSASLDGLPSLRDQELSPSQKFTGDALWSTVQAYCAGQKIDPALIGSRNDITELLRHLSGEKNQTAPRMLQGWRNEVVGKRIIEIVQGTAQVELSWAGQALKSRSMSNESEK